MELHLPSLQPLLWTSTPLIIFLLAKAITKIFAAEESTSKLPPGPWKLPIIGNLHLLTGALPHRAFLRLSERYGPLMTLQLGEISLAVVSSPKIAKEVLKTHDLIFSQRPEILSMKIITYGSADVITAPYGELWRQLRKICVLELLSSKQVMSFGRVMEEEVSNLVQSISSLRAGSSVDLAEKIFSMTNDLTARISFGSRCRDKKEFLTAIKEGSKIVEGFHLADLFPSSKVVLFVTGLERKLKRIHRKTDRIVSGIVEEHRWKRGRSGEGMEGEEDLVDVLLRLQREGELGMKLTDDNVKAVLLDMLAAGTDTSATTMVWAMSHLMKNPQAMAKAQEEVRNVMRGKEHKMMTETEISKMDYLKSVVKETLRLSPPVPLLLPRESMERCEINSYEIPKKTRVVINYWAIGRDPKLWENPECFEPARFLGSLVDFKGQHFQLIPFGSGRRGCPGILFAQTVIELTLANLLLHFEWRLPDGMGAEDVDMSEAFGITLARKTPLTFLPLPRLYS